MNLDDELIIGHISLSYATPERFTIKPLMSEEKIILPAKNRADILAVVLSIGLSMMQVGTFGKGGRTVMAALFKSPMSLVAQADRRDA